MAAALWKLHCWLCNNDWEQAITTLPIRCPRCTSAHNVWAQTTGSGSPARIKKRRR